MKIENGIIKESQIGGVKFSIQIIKRLTGRNRPGIPMKPRYTVYHETSNESPGANAAMHQRYLQNLENNPAGTQVSYHFVVDDREIIQCIPINEVAWCQGDGSGPGNSYGISIEQCVNSDGNRKKAEYNAVILHRALIKKLGLELRKHQDFNGKTCPLKILNEGRWAEIKSRINQAEKRISREDFIGHISPAAVKGWLTHRILPSITLAQAILESDAGNSQLAREAKSIFGIKHHGQGASYSLESPEYVRGKLVYSLQKFRAYASWDQSIEDRFDYLKTREIKGVRIYASLIGERDYRKAAEKLYQAGYATDPKYPEKLVKIIGDYGLEKYDHQAFERDTDKAILVVYPNPADKLTAELYASFQRPPVYLTSSRELGHFIGEIVQIGGGEVKGRTRVIAGKNRQETMDLVLRERNK